MTPANFTIPPRVRSRVLSRQKKLDSKNFSSVKERKSQIEQQTRSTRQLAAATELIARSEVRRKTLGCKYSREMHLRNLEDFKRTKVYTATLDPAQEGTREQWAAWREKEEGSMENADFRQRHLAAVYGKASRWGRIEEERAVRLANLSKPKDT